MQTILMGEKKKILFNQKIIKIEIEKASSFENLGNIS